MMTSFEASFPNIASFVNTHGYVEIGYDDDSPLTSFIRALDPGGMVWEGKDSYETMEEAFQDLEQGLNEWARMYGIDL
ncbi:MAG: hypothetical protein M5U01_12220 [Ardenticatenaceae bacterium]|nr:hypothetical protein [Ardenticatenaceae bacterium]HBY94058.1 hypothetical protein [Chloroflexota bacterium]